ncbi:MAG TPA: aldo/keto reductase [Clostridium sp.]|uniref:aldo/keto reductase n=1 Tax=uncultured Clostridium sp. TaxID=59620 RepID=UPI000E7D3E05|nr:aldo/keto reductase [uncultured Clostridium sp.]HBC96781.1 aldo/keto reductase [Clostridium sp.]
MLYRNFGKTGEKVSILGFGCMRLPLLSGGDSTKIDKEKAIKIIRYAIDRGVNYVDTAYTYHGNSSTKGGAGEPLVAEALKNGYREKVNLATKLPSWLITKRSDMDKYLNEQLERLQTDHIDFYLIHSLNRENWKKVKENGVDEFLDSAIKDGRIRYAGFSFHDKLDLFKEIVDYYNWSFCQMQYNYSDENFQAGTRGLKYAAQKGLGITIMEPLRGGKLVNSLPKEAMDTFDRSNFKRTPAEWGLRWVWNHPEVKVVLSGMNSMEQVKENIKTADKARANSLTEKELKLIDKVKDVFNAKIKVNCTGCEYCMPCPSGVNIPGCFSAYNNYSIFGKDDDTYNSISSENRASKCKECGRCESLCPQGIPIRRELKNVRDLFEKVPAL